jgi:hypothetical protein
MTLARARASLRLPDLPDYTALRLAPAGGCSAPTISSVHSIF